MPGAGLAIAFQGPVPPFLRTKLLADGTAEGLDLSRALLEAPPKLMGTVPDLRPRWAPLSAGDSLPEGGMPVGDGLGVRIVHEGSEKALQVVQGLRDPGVAHPTMPWAERSTWFRAPWRRSSSSQAVFMSPIWRSMTARRSTSLRWLPSKSSFSHQS